MKRARALEVALSILGIISDRLHHDTVEGIKIGEREVLNQQCLDIGRKKYHFTIIVSSNQLALEKGPLLQSICSHSTIMVKSLPRFMRALGVWILHF